MKHSLQANVSLKQIYQSPLPHLTIIDKKKEDHTNENELIDNKQIKTIG